MVKQTLTHLYHEILFNSKTEFTYSIKTQTINYWRQKKDVTFLFLVDIKKEIMGRENKKMEEQRIR